MQDRKKKEKKMKRFCRIFGLILIILSLAFAVWNGWRIFSLALKNFEDGKKNIKEGLPFYFGERIHRNMIVPMMKIIPDEARIYYWTIPELEKEISHECRAYELAYYLFPSRVGYKNNDGLKHCDFVICELGFKDMCMRKLTEREILAKNQSYKLAYENEAVAIFASGGKKIIERDLVESAELFRKRILPMIVSGWEIFFAMIACGFLILSGYFFLKTSFLCEIRRVFCGWELIPISFACGAGLLGVFIFYFSLFGLEINRWSALLIAGLFFCILGLSRWLSRRYTNDCGEKENAQVRPSTTYDVNLMGTQACPSTPKGVKKTDVQARPSIGWVCLQGRNGSLKKLIEKGMFFVLVAMLIFLGFGVIALAFSIGASDAAGQAVWGMKARQIVFSALLETEFLNDNSRMYTHPDYPPVWALLFAWLSVISTGGYNEVVIKLLSLVSLFMLLTSIFSIGIKYGCGNLLAMALTAIFAGNFYLLHLSSAYYAEAFLGLLLLWGIFFLVRYFEMQRVILLYFAFFFFGIGGLIKNEGVAIFAIAFVLCLIFAIFVIVRGDSGAEKDFFKNVVKILIFALLTFGIWMIFRRIFEVPVYDFDFSFSCLLNYDFWLRVSNAIFELSKSMFYKCEENCFFWYLLIIATFLNWKMIFKERDLLFITLFLLAYIFVIVFVFGFSLRRLDWHLRVMPRLLVLCEIIGIIFVLRGSRRLFER